MNDFQYDWDDKEWETHCLRMVQERHGPTNVKQVPDRHKGDLGIEFFTTNGCVYQCYAPEYPSVIKLRVEKINAKIRIDLQKFIDNEGDLMLLFGDLKIMRWILLVPLSDSKDIVLQLPRRTRKVKERTLPYVSDEFDVLVQDQSDFGAEYESLRRRASLRPPLGIEPSSDADIPIWANENLALAQRLSGKLERAFPSGNAAEHDDRFNMYARKYLDAENLKHDLRRDYPDLWDGVEATMRSAEHRLLMLGPDPRAPRDTLLAQLDAVSDGVRLHLDGFQPADVEVLTWGALADWLMRCPLDFTSES